MVTRSRNSASGSESAGGVLGDGSWRVLGLLAAAAVALRALAWSRTVVLFNDGPIFLELAEAMGSGRWAEVLAHPYHPLYPLAIHGFAVVAPGLEAAAALVSIVGGGLAVAALYVFLTDTFGPRLGAIGAATLALHPHAVAFSSDVQSDGLYMGLFVLAAALAWRGLSGARPGLAAAAGVASGLAYLTRPEGLGVVLVAGAGALVLVATQRWTLRAGAAWGAALAIGASAIVLPYVVAVHEVTGVWTATQKKPALQIGERRVGFDGAPAAVETAEPLTLAMPEIPSVPEPWGERALFAVTEVVGAAGSAMRFELLPFLLLGLVLARGRPTGRGAYIGGFALLYGVVLLALVAGAGYVSRRHALPPMVLCFGYLALGLEAAARWVLDRLGRRTAAESALVGALAVAIVAVLALPRDLRPRREDRAAGREVAEWLRAQPAEPGAVAASRLQVAYYADRRFVPLPSSGLDDPMGWLRRSSARYLILDRERLEAEPGFEGAMGDGLELLHTVESGGRNAMVFRILQDGEDAPAGAASPSAVGGGGSPR